MHRNYRPVGPYRHRAAIFRWKTLGAGSEFANSLTVEGNFRAPTTRRATNKMADATTSGRNLSIKYPTIAMLYRLYAYDPVRLYDLIRSYGEMFTADLRLRRLTMNVRSGAIYSNPPGGGWGSVSSSARSPSANLAFYRLFLKDDFSIEMNGKFRPLYLRNGLS